MPVPAGGTDSNPEGPAEVRRVGEKPRNAGEIRG